MNRSIVALIVTWLLLSFPLLGGIANLNGQQIQEAQEAVAEPLAEPFLKSGQLTAGQAALEKHLGQQPDDDQARFGLGVIHFLQSIEHLGQSWYTYGINEDMGGVAFFRLPVPENPNPQAVNYQDVRAVLQTMIDHLDESEKVLAQVKSQHVKLPLHLFQINLDFDQDGKIAAEEDMSKIYAQYFGRQFMQDRPDLDDTVIVFDYADVQWLRGYTHLIRAMAETILAHDQQALWDVVAVRVFKKSELRFDFQQEERVERELDDDQNNNMFFGDTNLILDAIAGIHNLNFKLIEPDRMKTAHGHLKQTLVHSREMWDSVMAEMDDDREWIPNPDQTSVVSLTQISKEMVETWWQFLDEVEAILDGKKLIPFWRGTDKTRGLNLHRVFHQPRDLDVILWIHGSAAVPFLEQGDVTQTDTWTSFQRAFGGQLFTFGAWFN